MSKQDYCPHCESPYSDERDENGLPYCTCDGAEMEKLTKENADLKAENAMLKAKLAYKERVIALARNGIPVSWIPRLLAQEDAEL